ncbi:mannitol dehydrogenase family protein [Demequina globuliformis]|uniref:mannitol dehydrogenase family protein n=1 Tax=Demequina globuliformis TaxID=676202 RepID=UPI000785A1E2|nr:mannitol dehydrogenase family protein [Demequina globuliformis]
MSASNKTLRPLTQAARRRPAAPVRIIHIGLGAFHRSHQAWYTAHASDASEWGIAAFTGRAGGSGDAMLKVLRDQDCLYTLTTRGPSEDEVEVIDSIVAAHSITDGDAFMAYLERPSTAIVTTTVTEAGYRLDADGEPDWSDPVVSADVASLASGGAGSTPLALITVGLEARRRAGAGPIAILPCDNMPNNGSTVRRAVLSYASRVSEQLVEWVETQVAFVSTSVDRITPRFSDGDVDGPRRAGIVDEIPVVTEPFASWILCGDFPAGRPHWESAGAQFTEDITPFDTRKLWLLNGAHTALAALGLARGAETVASATRDATCRSLVEGFWSEAVRHLPGFVDSDRYCRDLWERFDNPRIAHRLKQIAEDSSTKLTIRVAPVALAELAAHRSADGSAAVLASWINVVLHHGRYRDAQADDIDNALGKTDPVAALIALVSETLARSGGFVEQVRAHVRDDPSRTVAGSNGA